MAYSSQKEKYNDLKKEMGKPLYFDVDHYLDSVEQMICADEIVTALQMLDSFPGYYRDNYPARAVDIKKTVLRQLMNVSEYAGDGSESKEESERHHNVSLHEQWKTQHFMPRGPIMIDLVKQINAKGKLAEIHELGPANHWLPAALKAQGLEFKYYGYGITKHPEDVQYTVNSENPKTDKETIFCCFEVIEHLFNPDDIYHYYVKALDNADHVLIGCPQYTLFGGLQNWHSRVLGHIRTYTPSELYNFCKKHWPTHNFQFHDSNMMVMQGVLK